MARIASSLLVVGLLAGTAAAFAVTERLKLTRSPIFAVQLDRTVFSPVCECDSDTAELRFRLREPDRVTIALIDSGDQVVRTLVVEERSPAGPVAVRWDGRDDQGRVVPEGEYRPRVHLSEERRTIVMPNPIEVDVTPPEILAFSVEPRTLSPRVGERNNKVRIAYRAGEEARPLVFVDGERRIRGRQRRVEGGVDWFGLAAGKPLPAGTYRLELAAEDAAGNVGERSGPVEVEIRYVELARNVVRVKAGRRFGVRVRTDADSFGWRFAGGRGTATPGVLVLRAPARAGRYTLFVSVDGHGARARVIVEPVDDG